MPTLTPIKEIAYKDIDIRFTINPNTGDIGVLKNAQAISRSIKNLVLTNRYERPYKSNLSSDVLRSLFENYSPASVMVMENRIRDVIRNYEPRAQLLDVSADPKFDSNILTVNVIYRPINAKEPVEIAIFLERLR
jgi:phage baseplate assembly protein W